MHARSLSLAAFAASFLPAAKDEANRHISNMKVLQVPDNLKHDHRIGASFGTPPELDQPSSKITGARKSTSKSPTGQPVASAKFGAPAAKKLGSGKKLSTAKSLTKGTSRAGAKKVASAHTAGSKSLTKGASHTSAKNIAVARPPVYKSLTKRANGGSPGVSKKVNGGRTPKSLLKGAIGASLTLLNPVFTAVSSSVGSISQWAIRKSKKKKKN